MHDKSITELAAMFESHIDGNRVMEVAIALWEYERWFSSDRSDEAARWYANCLKDIGLSEVDLIDLPADGKTYFGGVGIPKRWNPHFARLTQVSPQSGVIADYQKCPMNLILYSESTAPNGWQGEMVTDESADVSGRAVLLSDWPSFQTMASLTKRGAVGVVCDAPFQPHQRVPQLNDAVFWHNASLHPFYESRRPRWGFCISANQGKRLRGQLKNSKVQINVRIDVKYEQGSHYMLSGRIPGETDEEVILIGHMYEPGANDNCSGLAVMMEVLRIIHQLIEAGKLPKPRRSIRLLSSMEHRGIQAYVNMYPKLCSQWFAGLCVDMVGSTLDKFPLVIHRQCAENPSFVDGLAGKIVELTCGDIDWRFDVPDISNDALIGEPFINTPCPVIHTPELAYHNHFDTPDILDNTTLERVSRIVACYAWTAASLSPERLQKFSSSVPYVSEKKMPIEALSESEAREIYPRKLFLGTLGIDDMTDDQLDRYIALGESPGWMGPPALDAALCFCDGSRSLYNIWRQIHNFGHQISLEKLLEHFVLLENRQLVEFGKGPQ